MKIHTYNKLNNRNGPRRTVEEWKQVFRKWCSHIKKKARDIYLHCNTTEGGLPTEKKLSDTEESMLQNISMLLVNGIEMLEKDLLNEVILPMRKKMSQLKFRVARRQRIKRPRKLQRETYHQFVRIQNKYSASLNTLIEALVNVAKAVERLIGILKEKI